VQLADAELKSQRKRSSRSRWSGLLEPADAHLADAELKN